MATTLETAVTPDAAPGQAPGSPAGPVSPDTPLRPPPAPDLPAVLQGLRFATRPMGFNLSTTRALGDVWRLKLFSRVEAFAVTSHPEHVKALFTAPPDSVPSLTGESPLRPIVGPNSVLTLIGPRHLRQRRLLLPPFHGEAVARYMRLIEEAIERDVARWPVGEPFALAPRMQAVTLDVIMGGVFGIGSRPAPGTIEHRLRRNLRRFMALSTNPLWLAVELPNMGRAEARGLLAMIMSVIDRELYPLIRARRAAGPAEGAQDVMSLLLEARDEDGQPLTDEELRDELVTLVLAGHETTANSLAWTFERLVRTPEAYGSLVSAVRGEDPAAAELIEATIHEGMRVRPVIPMIARLIGEPWRLGEYVVPAGTPVAISIIALHHRPDVYPDPFAFRPERFLDAKPGTYTWIPFGGGIRRCLGAALAMAEQRAVLEAVVRSVDLEAADPAPEPARQRNVTMIPRHGARVVVRRRI